MRFKFFSTFRILLLVSPFWGNAQPHDRFAGLHLDFHAGIQDSGIGKNFTPEMIDSMMQITQPDFIQVDCKGHPGISSYPTKVGNPAPAFDKDILTIWRAVTARYQVPLYVHYSGLWDNRAINLHPQWARINADGNADKNATSLFSAYADSLLIPQVIELATTYKLDGIWVDGDCWVLGNDYHPTAIKIFSSLYKTKTIPRKPGDPLFFEWMEFHRKKFRDYISRYADAAHKASARFKVTSNWSFSSMMPEPVNIPVDYLSGDVAGTNSLYSSAFESRCLALQGKPWDLMSWSFAWKNNAKATKSVIQLQQEAAEVLAQGGGFQTYWQQNRDGSPEPYQFRKMQALIQFCKERKNYCFQGQSVPQIGILYSTYAWRRFETNNLYSAHYQEGIKGILNLLLDNRLPVDILMDHQLPGRLEQYPLLVIPEWPHIDPALKNQLLQYVYNGGRLLVAGAEAVADFKTELGVRFTDSLKKKDGLFAGFNGEVLHTPVPFQAVIPGEATNNIGVQLTADDWRYTTKHPLATIQAYGKGKIAGIYLNMGAFYDRHQNALSLQLMQAVVQQMMPTLVSRIVTPAKLHQVITQKNDKTYIHLINAGGAHNNSNVLTYDEVAPLKNIKIEIQRKNKPAAVRLQPGNEPLEYEFDNQTLRCVVKEIGIYSILEIE